MLLVRSVGGPAQAPAGTEACYRVTAFSEAEPPAAARRRTSWLVESDGRTVAAFPAQGERLRFALPAALAGRTIRVMAYLHRPDPAVAVLTAVRAPHDAAGGARARLVALRREGGRYVARLDGGPPFAVGAAVRYRGGRGLMNAADAAGPRYDPADWRGRFGGWADFLQPIAACESGGFFDRINSYDRARFTFGLLQWAAHTPEANFVRLFRRLLALPAAAGYFPDLLLRDGAIHRETERGALRLETAETTVPLLDYLNPTRERIEEIEAVNAAKLIHWCRTDPAHREAQVAFAVEDLRARLRLYARRYGLDGVSDAICLVVCDIRHQGRARSTEIVRALQSGDALASLLRLGAADHPARLAALKAALEAAQSAGRLGRRRYDAAAGAFVEA